MRSVILLIVALSLAAIGCKKSPSGGTTSPTPIPSATPTPTPSPSPTPIETADDYFPFWDAIKDFNFLTTRANIDDPQSGEFSGSDWNYGMARIDVIAHWAAKDARPAVLCEAFPWPYVDPETNPPWLNDVPLQRDRAKHLLRMGCNIQYDLEAFRCAFKAQGPFTNRSSVKVKTFRDKWWIGLVMGPKTNGGKDSNYFRHPGIKPYPHGQVMVSAEFLTRSAAVGCSTQNQPCESIALSCNLDWEEYLNWRESNNFAVVPQCEIKGKLGISNGCTPDVYNNPREAVYSY